ncbi:MAG: ankyrin repeat domain-containing protein [Burkholderiaceae bacterium]
MSAPATGDESGDELVRRYREASAQDLHRPAQSVRAAVLSHARMLAENQAHGSGPVPTRPPAANQHRWKVSMLASVLLVGLAGLMVLQFDRGTPQEQRALRSAAVPRAEPSPPNNSAPATNSEPKAARADAHVDAARVPAAQALQSAPSAQATADSAASKASVMAEPSVTAESAVAGKASVAAGPSTGARSSVLTESAPAQAAAPPPRAPSAQGLAKPMQRDEAGAASAPSRVPPGTVQTPVQQGALNAAAQSGDLAQIDKLIAQGLAVDAPDAEGRTPLMLAVIHGHPEAVRRLIAAGASRTARDHAGQTALQHARRLGLDPIARLLMEAP